MCPGPAPVFDLGRVHVQNYFRGEWRDSYGKSGNFGRVGDKSMFKNAQKAVVGRDGDI